MRLLGYLFLSSLLATAVCWSMVFYFDPSFAYSQLLGSVLFVACLATLVGFIKAEPYQSPHGLVGAPLLFIGATLLLTFATIFLYDLIPVLLMIVASPMDVLGYYPPGADVPFAYGATIWFVSVLLLMYGGIGLGMIVRMLRAKVPASVVP